MNIEHGTFTPLLFALNGGVAKECSMFHKHIDERIATKSGDCYESVLTWTVVHGTSWCLTMYSRQSFP